MYNIKEVSELMGISPHTLRYYEKNRSFRICEAEMNKGYVSLVSQIF